MKAFFKIVFLFSILLSFYENSYSQIPSYTLQAKNYVLAPDMRSVTFDIMITHTNATLYEYAGGQYFFKVPQSIGNLAIGTATNSGFVYDSAGGTFVSDFSSTMIPRGPSVVATTINGVPSYELRLASNSLPGAGNGTLLPQGVPWLVIRMKIIAKTGVLNPTNANMFFRDSCSDNPVSVIRTKINAYIGTTNTEITRCANHSVDFSGIHPLISCNIKLAIEGLYNSSADKLLKRDSVTAYLRNAVSPYQIIDSAIAVIDSNSLSGNFSFTNANSNGIYYIVVKHRNSLETWSKVGGENLVTGNNAYDFTSSASQSYGNNMVLKGSRYCIYSGNVNRDMIIDVDDLLYVDNDLFNYVFGNVLTNLNGDAIVDIDDLVIADRNAKNLVLVEWPGLTMDMRKNLLKNNLISGGNK